MKRDDYQATFIVMLGFAAAILTGFLRQAVIAYQLGVGRGADIFLMAFILPDFVFVALPIVIRPAFIPLFTESRQRFGESSAWRLAKQTAIGLLFVLLILTLMAALWAPLYLSFLSPGFNIDERAASALSLKLMLPALSLMGLATLVNAILQVYRRFTWLILLMPIYNVTFAVALLMLPIESLVERAAWSVTLAACASLLYQIPVVLSYLRKTRDTHKQQAVFSKSQKSPIRVIDVARLAGPLAAGYAVHHIILIIDLAMATKLETGSVAALSFARHLSLVVVQLSGLAISTVLFPKLSDQISQEDLDGARNSLADALRLVWLIALPASAALILLRTPTLQFLFERGAFDQTATATVTAPLVWYAIAALSDAICQPLWRVIYAQKSAWTVLQVNGMQTTVRILGNIVFITFLGISGLALSAAVGLTLQALLLGWLVFRRLGKFWTTSWWLRILQILFAASLAVLVTGFFVKFCDFQPIVQILLCGGLGGMTYLLVLQFPKLSRRMRRGF